MKCSEPVGEVEFREVGLRHDYSAEIATRICNLLVLYDPKQRHKLINICLTRFTSYEDARAGRPLASSNACEKDKVMWLCVYNYGMNGDCVVKRSVELTAVARQMWKNRFAKI